MDQDLETKMRQIALALWEEQYALGIGPADPPDPDRVDEWIDNHSRYLLLKAAQGDVDALIYLRQECGLPILR